MQQFEQSGGVLALPLFFRVQDLQARAATEGRPWWSIYSIQPRRSIDCSVPSRKVRQMNHSEARRDSGVVGRTG